MREHINVNRARWLCFVLVVAYLHTLPPERACAKGRNTEPNNSVSGVTITQTGLEVTDKTLELHYRINNDSDQDVWLCKNLGSAFFSSEVSMTDDGEALLVRRRLDVPITGFGEQIFGSYIRIAKARRLEETILLPLPVRPHRVIMSPRRRDETIKHIKQLRIEIGYYSGNLPKTILRMLEEAEKDLQEKHVDDTGYPTDAIGWFGNSTHFNRLNEGIPDRNEQVIIPWTAQTFKGEQILRATVENLHVPYVERSGLLEFRIEGMGHCTRVEISYRPSLLEYLFPYPMQQSVLDSNEKEYLQSQGKLLVDDHISINALIHEIGETKEGNNYGGYIFNDRSTTAQVVCYQGDEPLASFTVYDDKAIATEEKRCYRYLEDLTSIELLTSQVQWVVPFRVRVECATNISKLWHRLRLYHKAERLLLENSSNEEQIVYPLSGEWCDVMLAVFPGSKEHTIKAHKCPSAGEGRCHYAMNPNCEPDSPGDMVLLFETKAGWNQHGGPELFAFDNHDPKGGCVLLNDGTVKFVRTKAELHALRWK